MPSFARDCDPTLGAVIAMVDEGEPLRGVAAGQASLGRALTCEERELIRAARDVAARQSVREAGGFCAERGCWRRPSKGMDRCYHHYAKRAA